jgi:hypothetical protein
MEAAPAGGFGVYQSVSSVNRERAVFIADMLRIFLSLDYSQLADCEVRDAAAGGSQRSGSSDRVKEE